MDQLHNYFFYYLSIIDFGILGSSTQMAIHPFVAVAASSAPKAEIAETNKAFILIVPPFKYLFNHYIKRLNHM